MSERFELGDESFGDALGVASAEVVAAEVGVEPAGAEHVPADTDERVLDGAECFLVTASTPAPMLGGKHKRVST